MTCPYCGFDLPEETQYRLHLGLEHYGRLDEAEQEGFKESYRSENDALDRFRIIALGGLVLLYFGFLVVYALLAA
ncbi:C2H2-type zinc finger protein [Halonotius terrestris]|uniref:C2H2-type zinc finger protein n=1 Tax=Halonotius terrestris TaxID=2487750 RepID=A0A8J8TCE7_9EURY|nr:C2H2-type zinc finger protein [Halonotius terrestris]